MLKAFLQIIRPFNCIFAGLCVSLGIFYSQYEMLVLPSVFAVILSAILIAAGGYVVNDYCDIEIDRINRATRVLPAGRMKEKTALLYSIALTLLGLIISFFSYQKSVVLIALINSSLLFLYAFYFKKKLLIGNVLVAYSAASTFIYAGMLTHHLSKLIPLILLSFLLTLVREWIKTIEDIPGDAKAEAKTIAVVYGEVKTNRLSLFAGIVILLTIFLMLLFDLISSIMYIALCASCAIPLIFLYIYLFRARNKAKYTIAQKGLKSIMLAVLVVFCFDLILQKLAWFPLIH